MIRERITHHESDGFQVSFNYCPNCGAKFSSSTEPLAPQTCSSCGRTQYHNSKPCAGAVIIKDNRVLFVRRAVEPSKFLWDLPGGFLEPSEHPLDGMLREVKEETGLDVRVIGLLGVYVDRYHFKGEDFFTLNHYYVVEPIGGMLRAADDVDAFEWFDLDNLPAADKIAFAHEQVVLRDLRLNRNAFRIVSRSD